MLCVPPLFFLYRPLTYLISVPLNAAGQLVEASWCLVRLHKTLHEAKQQHQALHQRVQGGTEDAAAQVRS
mgnify:CR=1 FL=1